MVTAANLYNQISSRIIKEQESIVGSLAWQLAAKTKGLDILNKQKYEVSITGEPKAVISDLIFRYELVFGSLAHDVNKQAVQDIVADMPSEDVPEGLK